MVSPSGGRRHRGHATVHPWTTCEVGYMLLLYSLLWSTNVTTVHAHLHTIQPPTWCTMGRKRGKPRRPKRGPRKMHQYHYTNIPMWFPILLTVIHMASPVCMPLQPRETYTHMPGPTRYGPPSNPFIPRLTRWNLARRLLMLANDVHPTLGPGPPNQQTHMSFLTLNVGGPFVSLQRWGHLLAEITADRPTVIALQEFRFHSGAHHAAWTAAMDQEYVPTTFEDDNPDTQFLVHNSVIRHVTKLPTLGKCGRAIKLAPPPPPRRQGVTPLLEVEDCTPASKRPRHSPGCTDPASGWRSRAVSRSPRKTPMRDVRQELFPSSAPPPSPSSCDETWLAPRSPATASTITCSTEGSRCGTPDPSRPLFGTPNTP